MIDFKTRGKLIRLKKNLATITAEIEGVLKDRDVDSTLGDGKITPEEVIKAVCFYYEITPEQLRDTRRRPEIVQKKKIAIKLLKDQCGLSLYQMADKVGYTNHATVIHHLKGVNQDVSGTIYGNKEVERDYVNVCELLGI
jgi:chromosomal replication initiation ATPase DnaA